MRQPRNTGAGNRPQSDNRRRQLAAIHAAKRDLGLDDETYRAAIWAICRAKSSADLDEPARRRLLDHFRSLGWKSKRKSRPRPSQDREALVGKVRAMLHGMDLPDEYADGMSKKMFHVERYEWCNPDQLHRLVAALEYHRRRSQRKPA